MLEAEAGPRPGDAPGRVDPDARRLIDAARAAGWRRLTVPATPTRAAFAVTFDGAGRYAWERSVGLGLVERVVCDGQTLWHLYPELGVGAKRPVSRFHRAELAAVVPWYLPPADDLARGADVVFVGGQTVAVVPHEIAETAAPTTAPASRLATRPAASVRLLLTFAPDGRLAERSLVETPAGRVLWRELMTPTAGSARTSRTGPWRPSTG